MTWLVLEGISALVGVGAAIIYGGYRFKQRDRMAADQPPHDFEKPRNEGDLL